jgi:transcriptional regulator with XRE-family HTH domain
MIKTLTKEELAKKLRELRLARGVTQAVVALNVGLGKCGYSDIERGKTFPSINSLIRLADYFEVSLDYLCGRDSYLIEVE